jgi:hypothetical protein
MKKIPNCPPVHASHGLCFYTKRFSKTGLFLLLGRAVPVPGLEEVPIELVGKTPPASEYAVFTLKGSLVGKTNAVKDTCY